MRDREIRRPGDSAAPFCGSLFWFLAFLPLLLPGCYGFLPAPNHTDRIRAATEQEHKKCDAQAVDPRLFSPDVVESVAPYYRYVQNGGSNASILHGAEIHIRPLPGMTPELVAHVLLCRSARLVLGRVQGAENEPYWLPDGWVKIDARSEEGSFVATLDGEDLPEAKEILARAQAFAAQARR
jgi:hypothetical protein